MWKAVFDSVKGELHAADNSPCQDCCRVLIRGNTLFFACADGAGSAAYADEGSRIACDEIMSKATCYCDNHCVASIDRAVALSWVAHIREVLELRASEIGCEIKDFATTLIAGISQDSHSCFMQIGDGAAITRKGDSTQCVFWPQSGEYANVTNFLTSDGHDQLIEFIVLDGEIDGLLVFTDGLERLALNFSDQSVHDPFVTPLLAELDSCEDPESLFEPLKHFLESESVRERSNDDRTLIVATRARDD